MENVQEANELNIAKPKNFVSYFNMCLSFPPVYFNSQNSRVLIPFANLIHGKIITVKNSIECHEFLTPPSSADDHWHINCRSLTFIVCFLCTIIEWLNKQYI